MGTRSTTKIYEVYEDGEKVLLLALYKQYDGYVEGWGEELKNFIKSGKFGNGIPIDAEKDGPFFNGIGDFALQLVCKFKESAGGLYATHSEDEQEYNYIIEAVHKDGMIITLTCKEDKNYKTVIG